MDWLNLYGLVIVILLLVPNMLYFYINKNKVMENKCKSKIINTAEQIGRYGSMALMVFHIGIFEFRLSTHEILVCYIIVNATLLLLYWMFWYYYLRKNRFVLSMLLAIIPSLIFLSNGVLLRHWLLVLFGAIFAVNHIYITYKNACKE